jgi:DNA-binding Lrp family transcriptional regulator
MVYVKVERPDGSGSVDGVIHSTFSLLRALAAGAGPMGVTKLAQTTGLPKATAHRLLRQLADEGIVERFERQWILSETARGLGIASPRPPVLADVIRPRLRAFSLSTGASLFLSIKKPNGLLIVDRFHGYRMSSISDEESNKALEQPASVVWKALEKGQAVLEQGEVHPDYACIGTILETPSGETAVLSLALPRSGEIGRLRKPLDRSASLIASEVREFSRRVWGIHQ